MNFRIIPRLDIKGPNLVKGIHLEGLRVLGKPEDFARHYYQNGADELLYMDAVASLYGRNSLLDIIERTSREIFIPLAVGGGLRSVDDVRQVLRAGADKVSINSEAVRNPDLIRQVAESFGSSTIVVSIEAVKKPDGKYEALIDYGRENSGVDAIEWAQQAESLGAGELIVTSIDQEGTGKGFDMELTRTIAQNAAIPVIASGGAGTVGHIREVITQAKADAVSIASILHYNLARQLQYEADEFASEGNTEFLRKQLNGGRAAIEDTTLPAIKKHLTEHGIEARL
jgi:cyclase